MKQSMFARIFYRFKRIIAGGNKPNFIIVGAQKSGTTSLFSYLNERAGFLGSQPKELHFFDRDDRFVKGAKWYESHFVKPRGQHGLFFEASPTYLHRNKVPERLKRYNPHLKIIILVREPVARAYSAWNMYRQWSEEGIVPVRMQRDVDRGMTNALYNVFFEDNCPSFHDYVKLEMEWMAEGNNDEEPSLLRRGLYKPQIERYVKHFGWDNILVLGFNELKSDSEAVIRKCHEFLGVRYQAPSDIGEKEIKNKRAYPSKISAEDLEILQEFYQQPNKELFDYLGFEPDW
jgi:hypothetical protein